MALIKCNECGQEISDIAAACPKCGKPTGVIIKQKSPWLAAILNFFFWFPGYFYVREFLLGWVFVLLFIDGIILYFVVFPPPLFLVFEYISGLLLSILLAIDGYKRVQKYNKAQIKRTRP